MWNTELPLLRPHPWGQKGQQEQEETGKLAPSDQPRSAYDQGHSSLCEGPGLLCHQGQGFVCDKVRAPCMARVGSLGARRAGGLTVRRLGGHPVRRVRVTLTLGV